MPTCEPEPSPRPRSLPRPSIPIAILSRSPFPEAAINDLFAELKAGGKDFPPESPRGLLAKATNRPTTRLAADANPRWAEPHAQLADLETEPAVRIQELKTAATLEPRNSGYWQALAVAQADSKKYTDADKSWNLAERNASTKRSVRAFTKLVSTWTTRRLRSKSRKENAWWRSESRTLSASGTGHSPKYTPPKMPPTSDGRAEARRNGGALVDRRGRAKAQRDADKNRLPERPAATHGEAWTPEPPFRC